MSPAAASTLDQYLTDVHRSLSSRPDVEAEDVVAGLREHVETELRRKAVEVATLEDMADVLGRLGPPAEWNEGDATAQADRSVELDRASLLALVLVAVGMSLVLVGSWTDYGWALVVTGAATARLAIGRNAPPRRIEGRMALVLWWIFSAAGLVVIVLGPAILVWGQAQIGGVLEGILVRRLELPTAERPGRYWGAVAAIAGAVTGAWWLIISLAVRRYGQAVRIALGPASRLLPTWTPSALAAAGGILLAISLVMIL